MASSSMSRLPGGRYEGVPPPKNTVSSWVPPSTSPHSSISDVRAARYGDIIASMPA